MMARAWPRTSPGRSFLRSTVGHQAEASWLSGLPSLQGCRPYPAAADGWLASFHLQDTGTQWSIPPGIETQISLPGLSSFQFTFWQPNPTRGNRLPTFCSKDPSSPHRHPTREPGWREVRLQSHPKKDPPGYALCPTRRPESNLGALMSPNSGRQALMHAPPFWRIHIYV